MLLDFLLLNLGSSQLPTWGLPGTHFLFSFRMQPTKQKEVSYWLLVGLASVEMTLASASSLSCPYRMVLLARMVFSSTIREEGVLCRQS